MIELEVNHVAALIAAFIIGVLFARIVLCWRPPRVDDDRLW